MSKILTTFFISLAGMALIITLSVLLIDNTSVLLSILLLEIVIYLVFLIFIQGMFIGHRQAYTTKKMLKHVKKVSYQQDALTQYLQTLARDFESKTIAKHITLYTNGQAEGLFEFKKKTYVSMLHLKKPLPLKEILNIHDSNKTLKNHKINISLTLLEAKGSYENFLQTIIYDHTVKPVQYHIPVFISASHIHLFDEHNYLAHPDLKTIIEYLNTNIKKT
jgi:hypothetical protein